MGLLEHDRSLGTARSLSCHLAEQGYRLVYIGSSPFCLSSLRSRVAGGHQVHGHAPAILLARAELRELVGKWIKCVTPFHNATEVMCSIEK